MPKPPFPVPAAVAEPAATGIDAAELGRAPDGVRVAAEAEPAPEGDAVAWPEPAAAAAAAAEGDPVFEAICAFKAATAAGLTAAAGVAGMIRELRVPSASSDESGALPAPGSLAAPVVAGAPAREGAAASPGWARP